ncbi:MAG: succinylglutamate desuccinylase/aspartoacylase family protein [Patescibacteria group bacterium]
MIFVKEGEKPGNTVTIMGGVHGDEICGVQAVEKAIESLSIERGRVYFILANLEAIERGVRQVDVNMNRVFRPFEELSEQEKSSYELKRAKAIMPFLNESVALLDVHSSMSKESTPFIICEPHSFHIAQMLPFPIRSHGWDYIERGGTDYFVNNNPHKGNGICVECGYHQDPEAPKRAYDSIITFLKIMDIISGKEELKETKNQREIYASYIYKTKRNFTIDREFSDFEPVMKGKFLGYDGQTPVFAPFDGVIIFARNCKDPNKEAFIMGKEKIN